MIFLCCSPCLGKGKGEGREEWEGKEQMGRGQEGRSWKGEKGGKEREYYCVAFFIYVDLFCNDVTTLHNSGIVVVAEQL